MGQMRTIKSMISRIGNKEGFFGTATIKSYGQYLFNPTVTVISGTLTWVCDLGYGTVNANNPAYPFTGPGLLKTMNVTGVDAVTNIVFDGERVSYFDGTGWTALTQLYIGDNDAQLVTLNIGSCTALTSLYIFLTSTSCTGFTITNNTLLQTFTVYGNTGWTTFATNYFENSMGLTYISLQYIYSTGAWPNFLYGAPITSLQLWENRFSGTLDLTGLAISVADVRYNPNLTSLILTNCNTMYDAYLQSNASLTSITWPTSTILRRIFLDSCTSLASLDLSNVTNIYNLQVHNCTSLKYINLTPISGKIDYLWCYGNLMSTAQTEAMIVEFKTHMSSGAQEFKIRNNRTKNIIRSGTTTADSGSANTIVDSNATFITSGVAAGDLVIATIFFPYTYLKVASVLSETSLTLTDDTQLTYTGQTYTIDNSVAARNMADIADFAPGLSDGINESFTT